MSEEVGVGRERPGVGVGVAGPVGVVEAAGCRETLGGPGPVRQWGWPTFWADRALPTAGWRTDGRNTGLVGRSIPLHGLPNLPATGYSLARFPVNFTLQHCLPMLSTSTSAPLCHVHLTCPPTDILHRL